MRYEDPRIEDPPLVTIIREGRPVAAIPHRCSVCNGTIPVGEKHVRIFYRDDDQRDVVTGRSKTFAVRYHIYCPPYE